MPTTTESESGQPNTKPLIGSTQNWMNVAAVAIVAIVGNFSSSGAQILRDNPVVLMTLLAGVNYVWRILFTKDKIQGIFKSK